MKYALALVALIAATPALATDEMSHAEFFERSRTGNWTSAVHETPQEPAHTTKRTSVRNKTSVAVPAHRQAVADMVAAETTRRMGPEWVPTALKLAKLESGFNCGAVGPSTRHGRARGVMQVMPGSARALGYDPGRLNECAYGISAGIAHMEMCRAAGAATHAQMASCHVSGVGGFNRKLNRRAEMYRQKYVRLARM